MKATDIVDFEIQELEINIQQMRERVFKLLLRDKDELLNIRRRIIYKYYESRRSRSMGLPSPRAILRNNAYKAETNGILDLFDEEYDIKVTDLPSHHPYRL